MGGSVRTIVCVSRSSEFVVCERVRAHNAKAVAGVIGVQKMDLVVDRIASTNCHISCGRCREMPNTRG
jgi:hypothetical protein